MEDILDEPLEKQKALKPIPLVLYFLMTAIFIYFLNILFAIQSWPYRSIIREIGIFSILITGVLSIKVFREKKDTYLNFYWGLFLVAGFSKMAIRFVDYGNPIRIFLSIGERFFILAILLALMRYFVLRRPNKSSLNIIKYPLLFTIPMWIVGFLFKIQSWPFASEILTVSAFVFLLGTVLMLVLKLKKERPALRIVNVWLVLMANLLIFGALFKIQSWPYASEMLNYSVLGGGLGLLLKFMQERKLQKEQETIIEE